MARRELEEINAGSMADIAFLLLIFFLVTTTMDQDVGLLRQLPPPVPENLEPPDVIKRNVYEVLVNKNDQLLVEGKPMRIEELKKGAKLFYTNPYNDPNLPELTLVTMPMVQENINKIEAALDQQPNNTTLKNQLEDWRSKQEAVRLIGPYKELPTSALISLQNDRGTSYEMYIKVQNELSAAVNELRDDLSRRLFGIPYTELDVSNDDDKPKILAIRAVYPQRISEAEPKNINNL